jgi:hypothetical protein
VVILLETNTYTSLSQQHHKIAMSLSWSHFPPLPKPIKSAIQQRSSTFENGPKQYLLLAPYPTNLPKSTSDTAPKRSLLSMEWLEMRKAPQQRSLKPRVFSPLKVMSTRRKVLNRRLGPPSQPLMGTKKSEISAGKAAIACSLAYVDFFLSCWLWHLLR